MSKIFQFSNNKWTSDFLIRNFKIIYRKKGFLKRIQIQSLLRHFNIIRGFVPFLRNLLRFGADLMMGLDEVLHMVILLPHLIKSLHLLLKSFPSFLQLPFIFLSQPLLLDKSIKKLRILFFKVIFSLFFNELRWLSQMMLLYLQLLVSSLEFLTLFLRLLICVFFISLKPQKLVSHRVVL